MARHFLRHLVWVPFLLGIVSATPFRPEGRGLNGVVVWARVAEGLVPLLACLVVARGITVCYGWGYRDCTVSVARVSLLDALAHSDTGAEGPCEGCHRWAVDSCCLCWRCGRGHGLLSRNLVVTAPEGCCFVSGCWWFSRVVVYLRLPGMGWVGQGPICRCIDRWPSRTPLLPLPALRDNPKTDRRMFRRATQEAAGGESLTGWGASKPSNRKELAELWLEGRGYCISSPDHHQEGRSGRAVFNGPLTGTPFGVHVNPTPFSLSRIRSGPVPEFSSSVYCGPSRGVGRLLSCSPGCGQARRG